MNYLLSKTQ